MVCRIKLFAILFAFIAIPLVTSASIRDSETPSSENENTKNNFNMSELASYLKKTNGTIEKVAPADQLKSGGLMYKVRVNFLLDQTMEKCCLGLSQNEHGYLYISCGQCGNEPCKCF